MIDRSASSNDLGRCEPSRFITGQTAAYNDRGAVTGIDATAYTGWGQGNSRTLTRTAGTQVTGYLTSPTGLMSGSTWNVGVRAYTRTPTGEVTSVRYSTSRYYFAKDTLGSVIGALHTCGGAGATRRAR